MLAVFHKSFRSVFSEEDTQFGEDTDVSTIESHTSFKKRDHFIGITEFFVVLSQFFKVIRVNDDVKTSSGSELKFSGFNAGHGQFLPSLRGVSLLGGINSCLELFKSNEARSNLSVVLGSAEEVLSSFVVLFIVATVTNTLVVNGVRTRDEVFKISDLVSLGKSKDESIIDLGILDVFTGHGQILNELIVFTIDFGSTNDLEVHRVVLSLNVRFDGFRDEGTIEVGVGKFAPNFNVVNLLSVFSSSLNIFDVVNEDFDGLNG